MCSSAGFGQRMTRFSLGAALLKTGLMVTGESKLWVGIKDLPTEVQLEMSNTTNIITITQIPNNQYGYRVQLLDTDGSPLKDVVIKGIDDPNTEIRTNSEGIVQFYSSKSSFSGLTYSGIPSHLDASMFPKTMQGYINDTSVVIVNPDISEYYGYNITVTNNDGSISANRLICDAHGTELGLTDSTGNIKLYRQASSLNITTKTTLDGYYVNTTVTGTKGSLKDSTVKSTQPYYGALTLGSGIRCCNEDWVLCHIDGKKYYLAAKDIVEMTQFGSNNRYSGSTLASRATAYQNKLTAAYNSIVTNHLSNVTVNGVTAKVFVASKDQMNGGFSYFNNASHRICNYNGSAQRYWTSSPDGSYNDWHVLTDGGLVGTGGNGDPSYTHGFRPFVCLSL